MDNLSNESKTATCCERGKKWVMHTYKGWILTFDRITDPAPILFCPFCGIGLSYQKQTIEPVSVAPGETKLIPSKAELDGLFADVRGELDKAIREHGSFHSAHEGYAVILEELDELWEVVRLKRNERGNFTMRTEATQVAAMAIRFMADVL
jgi:hypothetical protein